VVWKEEGKWNRRTHLGRQKEAFDAEMYAMSEAMKVADEMAERNEVTRVTVFTDSQATLRRIHSDEPGQGQVLALRTMMWANSLSVRIEVNVIDDRADISLQLTNTRVSRRAALMAQSRTNVTEPHLM